MPNGRRVFLTFMISLILIGIFQNRAYSQEIKYTWLTIQDDDGVIDSHWGQCSLNTVLCKIINLDLDPSQIRQAKIKYQMAGAPYHEKTKTYYKEQTEGIKWADMVILLNDKVVIQKPAIELATKGWHEVSVSPELLKRGENTIKFTWAKIPEDSSDDLSYGYFYLGIDTTNNYHRSCSSRDYGKTFSFETLRPGSPPNELWQGEYMVRLEIAIPNE